jgi:hypothetical protein
MSDSRELRVAILRTLAARHPRGVRERELISLVDAVERVRLTSEEREAVVMSLRKAGHVSVVGDHIVLSHQTAAALPRNRAGQLSLHTEEWLELIKAR